MTAETLLELAERCEKASGPDRGLDGWIWAHVKRGESYLIGHKEGRFPRDPIYGERFDVMREMSEDAKGAADYIGAPNFTASLDAAMTLVPEGCGVHTASEYGGKRARNSHTFALSGRAWARVYTPHNGSFENTAATFPLALCAASLRARAAQRIEAGTGATTKIGAIGEADESRVGAADAP